jgi:hypothetical protein
MLPTYQLVCAEAPDSRPSISVGQPFTLKRVVAFLFEVILCWPPVFQARMLKQMQKMSSNCDLQDGPVLSGHYSTVK